jgi:tRNA A37 threonylcarbamoyladenosine modification protein TsaB
VTTYAVGDPGGPIYAVLAVGRGRICVARYHFEQGLPVQEGEIELVSAAEWIPTDDDALDDPLLVAGEVNVDLAERLLSSEAEIAVSSLAGSLRRAGYLAELAWEAFQEERFDDVDTLGPIYARYPSSGTAD